MSNNEVRCPHGIVCDYVYTYTTIRGEQYVTGGAYWHDENTRCGDEKGQQHVRHR